MEGSGRGRINKCHFQSSNLFQGALLVFVGCVCQVGNSGCSRIGVVEWKSAVCRKGGRMGNAE